MLAKLMQYEYQFPMFGSLLVGFFLLLRYRSRSPTAASFGLLGLTGLLLLELWFNTPLRLYAIRWLGEERVSLVEMEWLVTILNMLFGPLILLLVFGIVVDRRPAPSRHSKVN